MTFRISFLIYETRDLNTFPSITNAIRLLTKNNYEVDVYVPEMMTTDFNVPGVKVFVVSRNTPYQYIRNTIKYIEKNQVKYDLIFAFYFEALVIAYLLNAKTHIPTIYFSMELIYEKYCGYLLRKLFRFGTVKYAIAGLVGKVLDIIGIAANNKTINKLRNKSGSINPIKYYLMAMYYYQRIQRQGKAFIPLSIVHDEERGKMLKKEFRFVNDLIYVPNSYIGYNEKIVRYAHDKYSIQKGKKIILYTGGIEKGFDLELLDIASKLPDEYVLFLNCYSRDGYLVEVINKCKMYIDQGKIIINDVTLDESQYSLLVKSVYIGIAWYPKPDIHDRNMYYLGWSSGKLMKYLSCGKPVIAPDYFYKYHSLIDENSIGLTCGSAKDVIEKINIIAKGYERFRKNIRSYYLHNLEYEANFRVVIERIRNEIL